MHSRSGSRRSPGEEEGEAGAEWMNDRSVLVGRRIFAQFGFEFLRIGGLVLNLAGVADMAGWSAKSDGPPMSKSRREMLQQQVSLIGSWIALFCCRSQVFGAGVICEFA